MARRPRRNHSKILKLLLKVSRGCITIPPKPVSASDLKLMRCMDQLHMQYPFVGSRMMRDLLNRQGHHIGRRYTRTLMKKMGIVETEQPFQTATPSYEFQDEYNQEYWSGQHCNAYTQEYPEDWLRRTQQRPRPKSPNTTY